MLFIQLVYGVTCSCPLCGLNERVKLLTMQQIADACPCTCICTRAYLHMCWRGFLALSAFHYIIIYMHMYLDCLEYEPYFIFSRIVTSFQVRLYLEDRFVQVIMPCKSHKIKSACTLVMWIEHYYCM